MLRESSMHCCLLIRSTTSAMTDNRSRVLLLRLERIAGQLLHRAPVGALGLAAVLPVQTIDLIHQGLRARGNHRLDAALLCACGWVALPWDEASKMALKCLREGCVQEASLLRGGGGPHKRVAQTSEQGEAMAGSRKRPHGVLICCRAAKK